MFLESVSDSQPADDLEQRVQELVRFVSNLEMGLFYSERLKDILKRPRYIEYYSLYGEGPDERQERLASQRDQEYREQIKHGWLEVQALVVELLRYQNWPVKVLSIAIRPLGAAPEVQFLLPIDNMLWNQGIIGFFSSVGGGGAFPLLLEGGDARGEALPLSFYLRPRDVTAC